MAMLLSVQAGQLVTPAQLLGTEAEEKTERIDEAQKSLRKLQRKMKKAGMTG